MPRVSPVDPSASHDLRERTARATALYGQALLPQQVLAHSPGYPRAYAATTAWTAEEQTLLDPGVRALAMQLVAEINACAWCVDYGRFTASARGVPGAKLAAVADWAGSALFSPAERAALAYAAEVTAVGCRVGEDTFAELARHFSEREIVELTAAIAIENFYNRLNAPLELEEQGFCAVPPASLGEERTYVGGEAPGGRSRG